MTLQADCHDMLDGAFALAKVHCRPLADPYPAFALFFSASDGLTRAVVVNATAASFDAAWQTGIALLLAALKRKGLTAKWFRVDWVEKIIPTTWRELQTLLEATKRNYFRFGLSLDGELKHAFLEQELNANAMLYGGNSMAYATLNQSNFSLYAGSRFPGLGRVDFDDRRAVFVLHTAGLFRDEDGRLHLLGETGLDAGRRKIQALREEDVYGLIERSSTYLARQVQQDGAFVYGYHPCFDRRIDTYNTLRHASTTYSMIEAWEVTRDPGLKDAIDRALAHLTERLISQATLPDGSEAAFLVDEGNEVKLGGNAVAILALAKHAVVTGTDRHHGLMNALAQGICFMQDAETGSFRHVLSFPSLTTKAAFRTIYYEGEAAFGLMRLYNLTGDERWLAAVERAFGHFIASAHWKHHDHWLAYCANELTRIRPEQKYFRFALDNVDGYLDFVADRITTFPTLLELMMATREIIARLDAIPHLAHLLSTIDLPAFFAALEKRAHYLLNGHFWPEMAMYFRKPDRIAGSFFIRHHAFRVRIDDVEHYLSGFVAYRKYLAERDSFQQIVDRHQAQPNPGVRVGSGWTAADVVAATGGRWAIAPANGWTASGLCVYAPAMQPGNVVVVKTGDEIAGVPNKAARAMQPPPAAVIARFPSEVDVPGVPVLGVADAGAAILAMGRYARTHMTGKVVGITGSAGKTTAVAMMAHVLSPWGPVSKSSHNANLPRGVAWNLASIPWDTPHVVLELAVGRMVVSAQMAKPDVAIFTNVLPAHLGDSATVADIARTKGAIFSGMGPDGIAVLNRDMLEWETVHSMARQRKLRIVHYGTTFESDFRLLDYAPQDQTVKASLNGQKVCYRLGAAGAHMALNSLAILAAVFALGHPLEPAIEKLASFLALPGRGEELRLLLDGRSLTVVDDAYNANPGSMKAALERLDKQAASGRRIAVLGEMAELGPNAVAYHTQLADTIEGSSIDHVHVVGPLYQEFWQKLQPAQRGQYAESLEGLKALLREELVDGDTVLFKGSHSTRVHQLVDWIKKASAAGPT